MAASKAKNEGGIFQTRQGRIFLENLTAYLFLAPAGLIIFTFSIFPVAFAFFVSLHRWRRFPGDWRGLDNYQKAIGDFAYVLFFWLALAAIVFGLYTSYRLYRDSKEDRRGLLYIVPGALITTAVGTFIFWLFNLLPVVMNIPQRIRGMEVNSEVFLGEFANSFTFPEVTAAANLMFGAIILAIILSVLWLRSIKTKRSSHYLALASIAGLALLIGASLMSLTVSEINFVINAAREAGESLPIWSQIIMISAGTGLLVFAAVLWQRSIHNHSTKQLSLRLFVVIMAVIGAVLLIRELPPAFAEADKDIIQGYSVTVMYSLFSVPLQLTIGLALAVLLYQNIRGKTFFRIVYFMPYITPFVATSVIFSLLFSHRSASPANQFLTSFGFEAQNWLLEPKGIFRLLFGEIVPDALAGPGLALVVIIFYNVWIYAGYSTVIFLAGLGSISPEIYEAARIDGANAWKQFRHITLPLLSPTTFFLTLIATIGTFQAFTQIFLMRRPGAYESVDTMNLYIYEEIRSINPDYAYGSALAFVLFAVILTMTLIQNRLVNRRVFYG
jgi:multiple sugar transport system permease protein